MNRRESLWLKFVRYWFGIDTKLDERELAITLMYYHL